MLRFQLNTTGNLMKDLIAFWPLDEPGGQRRDMLGYNPLTDNATVTSAKGIGGQGTAAQFTAANSEYLSVADNPQVSTGNIGFTISAWAYLASDNGANLPSIVGKWTTGQRDYLLFHNNGPISFWVSPDGAADIRVAALTPQIGRWYFFVAWHDPDADEIAIQYDNSAYSRTAHSTGVNNGTEALRIGAREGGTEGPWDGRIAYVGFWKRLLSQQERSDLYNSGRGNRLIAY